MPLDRMQVRSSRWVVLCNALDAVVFLNLALVMISLLDRGAVPLIMALLFTMFSCRSTALTVFTWSQLTRPHLWRWEHWSLKPPMWLRDLVPQRVTKDSDGGPA